MKPFAAYVRVSTAEQAEDGNGLDAQRHAILIAAARQPTWGDLVWFSDEGVSAKDTNRPQLQAALAALDRKELGGLVVSKLDRLSRSVIDFATLVQRAQKRKWTLVVLDPSFDLASPYGRAFAGMAAVWAQLERELIGQRTADGLAVLKRQGVRLGRPPMYDSPTRALVAELRHEHGLSHRAIAAELERRAVPTVAGGNWRHSTVRRILRGLVLDQEAAAARERYFERPTSDDGRLPAFAFSHKEE